MLATSTGGVGRHVRSLVEGLAARGTPVSVFGPAATDALFGFAALGARFTAVEIAVGPRPVADAAALRRLRRSLGGVDVVHAHGLRAGLLALLARRGGTPTVVTLHNAVLGSPARRATSSVMERIVVRRADVVLAASDDLASRAQALGGTDVRLGPVAAPALSAAASSRDEVRASLDAGERPLVLAVGRLHAQKGFDVLVEAAARLAGRRPVPLVVIAGDGPLEDFLRRLVAQRRAPVRLLGRRDDVADLLAAADLVVLPSRWEARALVAQEALRAGRPLVATSVGGLPGLLGDGARLVPAEQPAALATAVAELLDDPAAAAALAERGRRRAARWPDEAATVEQVARVYAELVRR